MSPWADCPIVEVRRDREIGLVARVPPFRGDRETAAVANTLAGLLAFNEGRDCGVVYPWFDLAATDDQADLAMIAASMYYRHHKARRGVACKKCRTLT